MFLLHLEHPERRLHLGYFRDGAWHTECSEFSARWEHGRDLEARLCEWRYSESTGGTVTLVHATDAAEALPPRRRVCLVCLRRYIREDEQLTAVLEARGQDFTDVR